MPRRVRSVVTSPQFPVYHPHQLMHAEAGAPKAVDVITLPPVPWISPHVPWLSPPGAPKAVDVITTDDRKKLLFDRKEQERLAKEKAEREAAEAELKKAMEEAREKTKPDLLAAPLRL